MSEHSDMAGDNLHVAARTVADDAARLAAEAALTTSERGLLIMQLDEGTLWACTAAATLTQVMPVANIVCHDNEVICFDNEVVTL